MLKFKAYIETYKCAVKSISLSFVLVFCGLERLNKKTLLCIAPANQQRPEHCLIQWRNPKFVRLDRLVKFSYGRWTMITQLLARGLEICQLKSD